MRPFSLFFFSIAMTISKLVQYRPSFNAYVLRAFGFSLGPVAYIGVYCLPCPFFVIVIAFSFLSLLLHFYPSTMKLTVVLGLVGLSAATPAIVGNTKNSTGEDVTTTIVKPFLHTSMLPPSSSWSDDASFSSISLGRSYRFQRRAEPAHGNAKLFEDDVNDSITATLIGGETNIRSRTTSTSTPVSKPTKAMTQATITHAVTSASAAASAKATSTGSTTSSSTDKPRPEGEAKTDESLDSDLEEFMNLGWYSHLAEEEDAPPSYEQVFKNQNAIASRQAIQTERLAGYDASECAEYCNRHRACEAFSIFIERQPSCISCSVLRSNKLFMCKLYSTFLESRIVTDKGNEQIFGGKKFTLAIRASNGYNRLGRAATVTVTTTRAMVSIFSVPRETKTVTTTHISSAPLQTITKTIAAFVTTTVTSTQQVAMRETVFMNTIASTVASTIANVRTRTVTAIEFSTQTITEASTKTVVAKPTHSELALASSDGEAKAWRPKTQYWRS